MSDQPARLARDVYDHDQHEEPRGSGGRRRRPVADWGVGEDMFEHMPRRRFSSHTVEGPPRDSRFARGAAEADDPERGAAGRDDVEREDAERPVARGEARDGRRTIQIGSDEDVPSEIAAVTADRDLGEEPDPRPAAAGSEGHVAPEATPGETGSPERRTVRIGGRPEGSLSGASFYGGTQRRRGRSASDRVGTRPERLAAWAFALGLLLILLAILTAH